MREHVQLGRSIFLVISLALAVFFSLFSTVQADEYGLSRTREAVNRDTELLPETVAGKRTVPEVIGAIVGVGLSMIGIVFFGLTIYSGFRWMTAFGNTEKVENAKETLIAASIGLVIVLAAYAITQLVFSSLAP